MAGLVYTLRSLRVDGDHSADPTHHRGRRGAIGRTLVAFLDAHLAPSLSPRGHRRAGLSWPVPEGLVVVYNPTVADLAFWAGVHRISVTDQQITVLGGTTGNVPPQASRSLPPGYNMSTPPPPGIPEEAWTKAIRRTRTRRKGAGIDLNALLAEVERNER